MGGVMAKVYVSSTIADLEAEREAVIDWLVAAQHQVVHSYRPSSNTVRDSCLDDVATCDLYVLIAGHRYGFQPPEDNSEGLSITHLEFRRAGKAGKPRVALVRTSVPDERLSDLANPERLARVLAFRAEVAGAVRTGEFGDLRGLVEQLSTGVQAELEKIQAELASLPAARGTGGRVVRLAPRPPFLAGREELLAELDARLAGGDGPEPRMVVLYGLGGAGKTSVAVEYAHRHLAEVGVVLAVPGGGPGGAGGRVRRAGRPARRPGPGRARDPVAAVHAVLAASAAGGCWSSTTRPDRASVAGVPAAGRDAGGC